MNTNKYRSPKRASINKMHRSFTLIELLVVIAIIAILAAVIMVSTSGARQQARDVRRTQDLDALATALEVYYSDHKSYPQGNIGPGSSSSDQGFCIEKATGTGKFQNLLTQGNYLSTIPKDPLYQDVSDPDYCYWYQTKDNGQKFKLFAKAEKDNFEPAQKDGGLYASHYEAYSINTGSNQIVFGGSTGGGGSSFFTCGYFTVQDSDGNIYNTVQIGTQCWLKQNLNVGTMLCADQPGATTCATNQTNNGKIEKYCYNNLPSNCDTYGGLYQWNETMGYASTCNGTGTPPNDKCTSPVQGICPPGWHIPSHYELTTLERAVCDSSTCTTDFPYDTTTTGWRGTNEGTKLKVGGGSGFEGLLGGYRSTDSSFHALSSLGYFWSSSQGSSTDAWYRELKSGYTTVNRYYSNKAYGCSVRCLKD